MNAIKTAAIFICLALAGAPAHAASFSFVAVGDTAYNGEHDYPAYNALIDQINKERPAFSIHVGDIWGAGNCHNEHLAKIRGFFDKYSAPVVFTPGDNEWIDCINPAMGGYEPIERLANLRETFFADAQSQGRRKMTVVREADVSPYKDMVENARWEHKGVLFLTLNVPGPNSNFDFENKPRLEEAYARNKANIAWLRDSLRIATENGDKAMVIAFHAEILGNANVRNSNVYQIQSGPFGSLVRELRLASERFDGQILVIHGDSHEFIIDRPFLEMRGEDTSSKYANLTRLEVFGAPDIGAVKVTVDTATAPVFSFTPLY